MVRETWVHSLVASYQRLLKWYLIPPWLKLSNIVICRFTQNTTTQWRRATQFFKKIYLSLYLKGLCVRGSWRPNRTAIYWPLHSYGHQRCVFLVLLMLNRRSGGPAFCWVLAFSTTSFHQTLWSPKLTDFLSSPSYIIVPWPTQSLEWHVWLSSSENNCHAVHR